MAPINLSHRRTHNLLLISKLLNLRDTASPFTLLLDSLEQPATPLFKEYIRRAKLSKVHVTLISFETLRKPDGVDAFISARRKTPADIMSEVSSAYKPVARRLILIDAINPLLSYRKLDPTFQLAGFLGSFITPNPTTAKAEASLVVTYHSDVPGLQHSNVYMPSHLSILTYLATSIITLHSFSHILAEKAARDRSLVAPVFGLDEEQDGVILGRLDKLAGTGSTEGIVLELEHRRKSGRGRLSLYWTITSYTIPPMEPDTNAEDEEPKSTFELGLTDRQRRDREGVVLPYFDAQHGDGPGEGGRILYDMGEEDDFDEEEDEI
ncbi:Histone acetylation protein 2 [Penicillium citrinum]|uniref:Elongator complex protein 5 n=2 Tax=Penicillium TaxID=5073 RepID=A0A9W9PCX7_PENCI|nr:Histone acetylation protein 2 [Penicillium citrinum]KAJ5242121.1 Histone acetylation protein 2 [Penicillium citrinum]KAJ5600388.1 Histone acetylation protein 2 [Penicillium hetheringtonii]